MATSLKASELVAAVRWLEAHRDGLGQWNREQIAQRLGAELKRHVSAASVDTALTACGLKDEWLAAVNARRCSTVSAKNKRASRERLARINAIEAAVREIYRRCGEPCPLDKGDSE